MGGAGAGAITNILLNLPQVLQQGGAPGVPQYGPPQYAPAPPVGPAIVPNNNGGWVPPGQRHRHGRWRNGNGDPRQDGDPER
jgi:hypothetical protein